MHLRSFLLLGLLIVVAGTASGQSRPTDSQSLQDIVGEIRQLRQELRTLVGTAQRAQILISRVQVQESLVRRLQERVDDARSRLTQLHAEQRDLAFEVKRNEELLGQVDDPKTRRDVEETLARFKAKLEETANMEQETQAKLTESEEQLRVEQANLGRLQDDLDQLGRKLQ